MKIERERLMQALEIVKPGLSTKEMIEQSTSFAFMGGRIVTYNDEISISHPIPEMDITGAVKADELYQLLNKIKAKEVSIAIVENELRIKAVKARAGITLQSEIQLPLEELGDIGKWKKCPALLRQAMQFTMFSCSTDNSKPKLTCVHVMKEGRVESCNNFRLTQFMLGEKVPIDDFLIPVNSVKALVGYNFTYMAQGQGWVHFKTDEDTIFSCRVFDEEYPDVSPLFDVPGEPFKLPATLLELLDKAAVFSKREHFLDEVVEITITADGKLKIRSQDDIGWFEEETAMGEGTWKDLTITINPTFLKDVLTQDAPCIVTDTRMKFTGENWEHVVALVKK